MLTQVARLNDLQNRFGGDASKDIREFNSKNRKILILNGREYLITGIATANEMEKSYSSPKIKGIVTFTKSPFLGLSAICNGKEVIITSYRDSVILPTSYIVYNGFPSTYTLLSKTRDLSSPLSNRKFSVYGGDFLNTFHNNPPVMNFNFNQLFLTHYISEESDRLYETMECIAQYGILSGQVTGKKADGETPSSASASLSSSRSFKGRVGFLLDIGEAINAGNDLSLFSTSEDADKVRQTGIKFAKRHSSSFFDSWTKDEVRAQWISPKAIRGIFAEKEFQPGIFDLITQGKLPPVPVYDSNTGELKNKAFLEEVQKRFVYAISEPSIAFINGNLSMDVTMYTGNWSLATPEMQKSEESASSLLENLKMQFSLRYGIPGNNGTLLWSDQGRKRDLTPFSIVFLGINEHHGYKLRLTFKLPRHETIKFVLQARTEYGQEIWVKNGTSDFELKRDLRDISKTTVSDFSA